MLEHRSPQDAVTRANRCPLCAAGVPMAPKKYSVAVWSIPKQQWLEWRMSEATYEKLRPYLNMRRPIIISEEPECDTPIIVDAKQ